MTGRLRAIDPGLPVFNVVPLEEHVQVARFQQRMAGSLLAGFGALALLLAAVGLYGVLAFAVGQRTREIGIRMALGGRARDIYLLVARQGLALIGIGVLVGLAAAAAATRVLRSMLIGVSPTDPVDVRRSSPASSSPWPSWPAPSPRGAPPASIPSSPSATNRRMDPAIALRQQ